MRLNQNGFSQSADPIFEILAKSQIKLIFLEDICLVKQMVH